MLWILTTILTVLLVEMIIRLPLKAVATEISSITRRSARTLLAKSVSDHWKERAIMRYACLTFTSTLKLLLILLVLGAAAALFLLGSEYYGVALGAFVFSGLGLTYSLVAAGIYVWIRISVAG